MWKWSAIQNDGQEIKEERGFGLSEDERNACKYFFWNNDQTGQKVGVNLKNGKFDVDGQILIPSRGDVESLTDRSYPSYRLIYFKRHFFTFGDRPGEEVVGLLGIGWQFTEEGKNIKRLLYITPNNEIIFGGED